MPFNCRLYHYGPDIITIPMLVLVMLLSILLPYQLSVVIRCLRLVKKGGQHYVVPEEMLAPTIGEEVNVMSVVTLQSQAKEGVEVIES